MHLETEQIPNPRYAEIQSSLDALTKSVGDIEAGITVTFSDGVTPVTMEYLTNEINNAHYRLSITSRCITVNHGYGQLYPLVKRIDYERTIQEMARVTSTSLAEESAKIIDVFEKAVTNLKEVASRAQAEKEVREQEIIELQTEAANLEAVSNKATAMAEKIGGLLS